MLRSQELEGQDGGRGVKRRGVRRFIFPSQKAHSGKGSDGNGVSLLFFCVIAGDRGSWQLALA